MAEEEEKEKEKEKEEALLRKGNYSLLSDLRVELIQQQVKGQETTLSLCFWLYLAKSISFPITLIQKFQLDAADNFPFLIVNEKKLMLFPLLSWHEEARDTSEPNSNPHLSVEFEFPFEKWVHFGCEVSSGFIRLHIDGEIVGDRILNYVRKEFLTDGFENIYLISGGRENNNKHGYIYNLEILPANTHVKDHQTEDPPVQLLMDKSSAAEIEEVEGGVWSIVGGKASCRRNFSLDVVLVDAFDQPISNKMEVVASLVYLDNEAPVERTSDGEAPLLASYEGIEFASSDRPSKLLHGRATFRLKISQLSSKCQSRLFRIVFHLPQMEKMYPFFEAFSPPIHSISRNRNTRVVTPTSTTTWKRSTCSLYPIPQPNGLSGDTTETQHHSSLHETKRLRLGQDRIFANSGSNPVLDQPDEECNSHVWTVGPENSIEDNNNDSSDSESTEVRNSAPRSTSTVGSPISDITVFKYGLAGITERSLILKEIATSAADEVIADFSHQVSLYSGCSHHSTQIMMAKRLVVEGTKAWNSISQNESRVQWESVVFGIEEQFARISRCGSRSLLRQDLEILRRISGCQDYVARENFEQMWCWLYPVAHTLSRDSVNAMWSCTSPKWIEGFVTKEEAESSLLRPTGIEQPGTFVLRFPTSRSWPHPDAGSLVATFVGSDYTLHHKLVSLDRVFSSVENGKDVKPLQDLILEEPELSRLGRVIRSN